MLYRFALVALIIGGCNPAAKPSTDNGNDGPDAGTGSGPGPDAGHGHNCGGACPDAGMDGGSGGGTIKLGAAQTFTTDNAATWVTAGDLDGDGVLDLSVSCPDDASGNTFVDALKGNGTGGFAFASRTRTNDPAETVIADFNRDGIADIAGIDWDGMGPLGAFDLQGTGSFMYTSSQWGGGLDYNRRVSKGDFDEDGVPDLVAAWFDSQTPMSTLGGFVITKMPANTTLASDAAFGNDTGQAIAGDFNGDGHQDVVVASRTSGAAKLYLGDGTGAVAFTADIALPTGPVIAIATFDLDGDGRGDLVAVGTTTTSVSFGTTLGFSAPQDLGATGQAIADGDFDHDGRTDLAFGSGPFDANPNVTIYLATGVSFVKAGSLAAPSGGGFTMTSGDFNGDGFADLALPGFTNVQVFLSTP